MAKIKIYKLNEPKLDYTGQVLSSDYAFKNLAITDESGTFVFAEINENVLFDALINTPEFLKRFGYEMLPLKKENKIKVKKEFTVEPTDVSSIEEK